MSDFKEVDEAVERLQRVADGWADFTIGCQHDLKNTLTALSHYRALLEKAEADLDWFCRRVRAGEVRSKKSYARFEFTLSKIREAIK